MSKKNKNFNKNFSNEAPDVYNMDDIGYMVDEAIHDRVNRLENERSHLLSADNDPYLCEVEIAYLQREQQLRQTRAECHAEFVQKFGISRTNVDATSSHETTSSSVEPEKLN